MPNKKFLDLVDALYRKTQAGRIRWEETPDPDAFQAVFEHGGVILSCEEDYTEDGDRSKRLVVTLANSQGRLLEEHEPETDDQREQMWDLYQLARSQARKSESVIDDLLRELA